MTLVELQIPVYLLDSWVYGRATFPTFNILWYNLLAPFGGPNLYGTSPATYYLQNLFLNFNFLLPLALLSLPALAITYQFDYRRLGKSQMKPVDGQTSPFTLLITRLAPFYIWLGVLSAQAHKEERFFFPAYPLLCFNAAVTVFLAKGWMEVVYIKITKSPYQVSRDMLHILDSNQELITRLVERRSFPTSPWSPFLSLHSSRCSG